MSTLLLDSIYAIVAKDSIGTTFVKTKELCQFINEARTNDNDIVIVFIICATIVLVALIVMGFVWLQKKSEFKVLREEFEVKKNKDEAESVRKQKVDLMERKLEIYKKILEKRLEILKDLCYEEKFCDKTQKMTKTIKNFNSQEIIDYCKFLEKELVPSEGDKSQTITQKYLEAIDEELKYYKECSQTLQQNQIATNENE